MGLKERIDGDLKEALLGGEVDRVTTLRGLKASILNVEVAEGKREKGLSDAEIEKLLMSEVKKRKEAMEMYGASGRGDLYESEAAEAKVIEGYLPEQMSEAELIDEVEDVLAGLPQGQPANMGMVIGKVKMLVGNKADGAMIAKIVKERIG